ncbi:MAG: TnpV protein [Coprobacillus cateniformis]|uniref:TnpV protein n=1 Tax=Longibaculum muris TaxID=1796628 RepID=UPI003AB2F3FD|nr:TnpV protein [Coprobacillus cateniformis]
MKNLYWIGGENKNRNQHPVIYTHLLVSGDLFEYLEKFDNEMNELYDYLVMRYKMKWGISEELKDTDQISWVQEMNNVQHSIEEFIKQEYIYI